MSNVTCTLAGGIPPPRNGSGVSSDGLLHGRKRKKRSACPEANAGSRPRTAGAQSVARIAAKFASQASHQMAEHAYTALLQGFGSARAGDGHGKRLPASLIHDAWRHAAHRLWGKQRYKCQTCRYMWPL